MLRPFALADAGVLHGILSDRQVLRYMPTTDPPPLERVECMIAGQLRDWGERGYGWWAVEHRQVVGLIGWCGIGYLPDTDENEVAYLFSRACWGQGLATEAARRALEFGFEEIGLAEIIGLVHPDNVASRRVLEKTGMRLVNRVHYFGIDVDRYRLRESEIV